MKLRKEKEDALADMQGRKEKYLGFGGFAFVEKESSDTCLVFADEFNPDTADREGEFHICLVELDVN